MYNIQIKHISIYKDILHSIRNIYIYTICYICYIYIYIIIIIIIIILLLSDLGNARVIIEAVLLIQTITPLLT